MIGVSVTEVYVDEGSTDWLGLKGSRVLIAGAGGIGSACAQAFASVGAKLAILDISRSNLNTLNSKLKSDETALIECDATEPASASNGIKKAAERLGGLDVFVHAVGINIRKPVLDVSAEEWHSIERINLDSAFYLSQAAGRIMISAGYGRIVLLSSVSGLLAHAGHAPYAASKGGINQMMRVMAREWATTGVTVNAIAPGYVETELTKDYLDRDGHREQLSALVPAGRLGTPSELSGPVLFLASKHASFITGHVLYIDGGRTLV